jgi:hypothetical protein
MSIRLIREVAPPTRVTSRAATRSVFAISWASALFAAPSLGAADTRTLNTARPSDSRVIPSIESRPALGVSLTVTTSPSGEGAQGLSAGIGSISQAVFQIADYDHPDKDDDQEKNNKRNVDAAEIWKPISYRFQQRLGDAIEEIADDRYHRMARIHDVENDQPAQDCRYKQQHKVDIEELINEQQ